MLNLITKAKYNLLNLSGWSSNRKIVVIESDDWGSIRMPSKKVYQHLLKKGYKADADPYLKYDSLATETDLKNLFDVLQSVKDKNGNNPVITANTIVANPDFLKIQDANFESYFYEPFTKTLRRYPGCENSLALWKEGISANIFFPQFHGREHLNVAHWMQALQRNDDNIITSFKNGMISISSEPSHMKFGYMEGLDFFTPEEGISRKNILEEGVQLFETIFNFKSASFIANCYIWDDFVEEVLHENAIKYLQGVRIQKKPDISNNQHHFKLASKFTGKKNALGQTYLVRNAFFEPSQHPGLDAVDDCLKRISAAFYWKKPVLISSHRLNFIGAIDESNRIKNLKAFQNLLKQIVTKWPEVEFMTSEQLGDLINE